MSIAIPDNPISNAGCSHHFQLIYTSYLFQELCENASLILDLVQDE